jgi:hypothetical protein
VTVTVSAPGYESGSDTFTMINMVIPNPSGGYVHNCPWGATTTTTTSPPLSAVPFIGVPEILIAILLGFFLLAKLRRRRD